jgi:hypothetical protein
MGNAVGNDTSLAATCAGQKQERTFDVSNRFPLLGIETCEKIHEVRRRGGALSE